MWGIPAFPMYVILSEESKSFAMLFFRLLIRPGGERLFAVASGETTLPRHFAAVTIFRILKKVCRQNLRGTPTYFDSIRKR